jgi:chromosome segregation ATPase
LANEKERFAAFQKSVREKEEQAQSRGLLEAQKKETNDWKAKANQLTAELAKKNQAIEQLNSEMAGLAAEI